MKTWVIVDGAWFLTDQPGVYATKISDGVALFTKEEAQEKLAELGHGFTRIDISRRLATLLHRSEEQVRLASLELGRVKKLIEKSGIGSK